MQQNATLDVLRRAREQLQNQHYLYNSSLLWLGLSVKNEYGAQNLTETILSEHLNEMKGWKIDHQFPSFGVEIRQGKTSFFKSVNR
jgi:hypothetical protein